jgi:hypothetical protein
LSETFVVVLVAALLSAGGVTVLAWRVGRVDAQQPERLIGELRMARWAGLLLAGLGGIAIGLSIARPDLATGHLDAALGVVFLGVGGLVLQQEPREALLLSAGAFLLHALVNLAHRPGWLSVDVVPHWYVVGCATFDAYLAALCYWVRRR